MVLFSTTVFENINEPCLLLHIFKFITTQKSFIAEQNSDNRSLKQIPWTTVCTCIVVLFESGFRCQKYKFNMYATRP